MILNTSATAYIPVTSVVEAPAVPHQKEYKWKEKWVGEMFKANCEVC